MCTLTCVYTLSVCMQDSTHQLKHNWQELMIQFNDHAYKQAILTTKHAITVPQSYTSFRCYDLHEPMQQSYVCFACCVWRRAFITSMNGVETQLNLQPIHAYLHCFFLCTFLLNLSGSSIGTKEAGAAMRPVEH